MTRFVVAERATLRGEGLGNEMIPWAKGFIASQVLNAHLVGPSWGLNPRKYYRNFQTGRLDFVLEDVLKHLPHHEFTYEDYLSTGEVDFGRAIAKWAAIEGILKRRTFVVTVGGMWGGYPSIRSARPFLWAKLLNSRDAMRNVYEIASKLDRGKLFVAVHMRFGSEFAVVGDGDNPRGKINVQIPGEWYLSLCESLRNEMGDRVQFHFFTDRGGPAFDEAVRRYNPGQIEQAGLTECSDLLLMSMADLRICSISSYSLMASFLSDGLYIWYEPQLTYTDGMYTLWGMENAQRMKRSPTSQSVDLMKTIEPGSPWETAFKGYAMGTGSTMPRGLVEQLHRKLLANDRSASLLEYGCLPDWTMASHCSRINARESLRSQ
jgi:hypothetical protein